LGEGVERRGIESMAVVYSMRHLFLSVTDDQGEVWMGIYLEIYDSYSRYERTVV
jgi:hypothetical protein